MQCPFCSSLFSLRDLGYNNVCTCVDCRGFYEDGAIMLGEEAGLLADTLIGLNTIDFRYSSYCVITYCDSLDLLSLPVSVNILSWMNTSLVKGRQKMNNPPVTFVLLQRLLFDWQRHLSQFKSFKIWGNLENIRNTIKKEHLLNDACVFIMYNCFRLSGSTDNFSIVCNFWFILFLRYSLI